MIILPTYFIEASRFFYTVIAQMGCHASDAPIQEKPFGRPEIGLHTYCYVLQYVADVFRVHSHTSL
jgi:hypothetical protein